MVGPPLRSDVLTTGDNLAVLFERGGGGEGGGGGGGGNAQQKPAPRGTHGGAAGSAGGGPGPGAASAGTVVAAAGGTRGGASAAVSAAGTPVTPRTPVEPPDDDGVYTSWDTCYAQIAATGKLQPGTVAPLLGNGSIPLPPEGLTLPDGVSPSDLRFKLLLEALRGLQGQPADVYQEMCATEKRKALSTPFTRKGQSKSRKVLLDRHTGLAVQPYGFLDAHDFLENKRHQLAAIETAKDKARKKKEDQASAKEATDASKGVRAQERATAQAARAVAKAAQTAAKALLSPVSKSLVLAKKQLTTSARAVAAADNKDAKANTKLQAARAKLPAPASSPPASPQLTRAQRKKGVILGVERDAEEKRTRTRGTAPRRPTRRRRQRRGKKPKQMRCKLSSTLRGVRKMRRQVLSLPRGRRSPRRRRRWHALPRGRQLQTAYDGCTREVERYVKRRGAAAGAPAGNASAEGGGGRQASGDDEEEGSSAHEEELVDSDAETEPVGGPWRNDDNADDDDGDEEGHDRYRSNGDDDDEEDGSDDDSDDDSDSDIESDGDDGGDDDDDSDDDDGEAEVSSPPAKRRRCEWRALAASRDPASSHRRRVWPPMLIPRPTEDIAPLSVRGGALIVKHRR
jgi:hypothetical protein